MTRTPLPLPRSLGIAAAAGGLALAPLACNVADVRLGDGTPPPCVDASDLVCLPFANPTLVTELTSSDDDDKPTLTRDMLQLYFYSKRSGGPGQGDVWTASRSSVGVAWSPPTLVAAVSTSSRETSPALSADGLSLWVASDRSGGQGGLDIWVSTRASPNGSWSDPVAVPELSSPGDELPRPPGYGSLLMPLSYRPTPTANYQTYRSARAGPSAAWSAPALWASIDAASLDDDGFLTDDGLTMYFSTNRLNGTQDLFVARRATPDAEFAPASPLESLNTDSADERDPWVSPDGHEIYFTSDRSGSLKIYHAAR